ncbi:hypothetical protein VP01_853g6 [Puccinia sorghi]|uniref:Uncharacterized protein n=1 Tax=Puccinia sorghi TaxID=27349 RepID=A0A0L6U9S9_9BASI|nr:hypothetical protein VP01_853g6 [Puccinia sorghi]
MESTKKNKHPRKLPWPCPRIQPLNPINQTLRRLPSNKSPRKTEVMIHLETSLLIKLQGSRSNGIKTTYLELGRLLLLVIQPKVKSMAFNFQNELASKINLTPCQMKAQFKNYKEKYKKFHTKSISTGFGLTNEDQGWESVQSMRSLKACVPTIMP